MDGSVITHGGVIMRTHYARLQTGFTLIELIIILAVLIIITGIGIPASGRLLDSSQQAASVNNFATALAQARYHAVMHSVRVILCPSTNQTSCTGGYDWQKGFISFVDDNRNRHRDNNEKLINVGQETHHLIGIQTSIGRQRISFRATGDSPGSNTTFKFCPRSEGLKRKALILSNTGRARLAEKMPNGSPITCI